MKIRLGIAILFVLAVVVIVAFYCLSNGEPTYQGKQLSYWLQVLRSASDTAQRKEAMNALTEIGTNPVPALLKKLRSGNWEVRYQAEEGFKVLGPVAKSAIPEILSLMKREPHVSNPDKESSMKWLALAYSLGAIGPDAFPPVMDAMTNSDPNMRLFAEETLGCFDFPATNMTSLSNDFRSSNLNTRTYACIVLRSRWRNGHLPVEWYQAAIHGLACGDSSISNECATLLYFQGILAPAAMRCENQDRTLSINSIVRLITEESTNKNNESSINARISLKDLQR